MTAAITVAKPPDNARPGMTVVECRPSARTALDDSRQPAHSYGSEGRAAARRGCRPGPRGVWAVAPAVSTPHCLRGTRQGSSLRQRGRTPHPCDRRAISVQLAPATSGRSRSLADTPTRRSGHVEGRSRTDSQADSAGSIPVTPLQPRALSSLGVMTTAEDDPDREHESQAEVPAPADETPTPLRKAAAGVAEAQAWKGQQIAKGWRKLVNALRRREEGGGTTST
jgi:hypothetical protein